MVRPGPKTTQDEVKTAVVGLLKQYSEGLNFNEIFRRLKEQRVLGSFSVLSRAIKDLCDSGIVEYKDAQMSRYRIPKRVYTLSDPMVHILRQLYLKEKQKEKVALEEIVLRETLLHHLFLTHVNNVIAAYRYLLQEENPSDENAKWKFILNLELKYMQVFMDTVAKAASKGKISFKEAGKVAHEVHKRIMAVR